jgi:hypothetical protein
MKIMAYFLNYDIKGFTSGTGHLEKELVPKQYYFADVQDLANKNICSHSHK